MVVLKNILTVALAVFLPDSYKEGSAAAVFNNKPDKDWKVYKTGLKNLSGICFNKDKTLLLAVTDKGNIYELDFQGKIKRQLPFDEFGDFEAITINPQNGKVYLADENTMSVYQLNSDEKKIDKVVSVTVPNATYNRGIEGVSYGKDTLYIANQADPCRIFKYHLKDKKMSYFDVPFSTFLSDIFYDATDNTLWLVDCKKYQITHCNLNGQIIAQQNIPMVRKAEAIAIDREKNIAWIGCDKTGNLYQIKLKI